jgi:LysR family transcriptional regulator, benzoate and cis,cis-muconate-responsive activator of ben and cat genes
VLKIRHVIITTVYFFPLPGMFFCYSLLCMEMRHLKYFTAAAEELNISKASRRLHISQPAISRLVRDLEEELGTTLFIRERFGLTLTTTGEKFLIYARRILEMSDEAVRVVRSLSDASPIITIGFMASTASSFLGAAINSFSKDNPGVWIRFKELSPGDQVDLLRKRQLDIALLGNSCGTVQEEFATKILFETEMRAIVPSSHPLAKRKSISLKELANDTFIGFNEESYPGRNHTIITACSVAGFKPDMFCQASSLMEVLTMVGTGRGVCLMPADVAILPHLGAVFVSVLEKIDPIRFTAAWRRDDNRKVISELIATLRNSKIKNKKKAVTSSARIDCKQ